MTASLVPARQGRSWKAAAIALVAALGLAACQTTGGGSSGGTGYSHLSPEQRQLRQQADRFNQTVTEGAVIGAIGGALLGALINRDNPGRGMLIGGVAGAGVGAGAGYAVASQQQQYASQEQRLNSLIQASEQEIQANRQAIAATEQVVRSQRANIAQLRQAHANGQIDANRYRSELARVQEDREAIARLVEGNSRSIAQMNQDIQSLRNNRQNTRELEQRKAQLERDRDALQRQLALLSNDLTAAQSQSGTPTSARPGAGPQVK